MSCLSPRVLPLLFVGVLAASEVSAQGLLHALISPDPQTRGSFGYSVAGVPDADGDGRADLLVGAVFEDQGPAPINAGRAYLLSGLTGAVLFELTGADLENGYFGWSVAGVPDLDGDGRGDLLVGAAGEDRAYLFSGASGTLIRTIPSPSGFGDFGQAVSGVPDADGDGTVDLLVGAPAEGSGKAYLFSGASGALLATLSSTNPIFSGEFGLTVAGVPDVDGDGRGDLAVGAPRENVNSDFSGGGRTYLFSGATGKLLRELVSPNVEAAGLFGWSVAGVPDLDGDGRGDLLVGARNEDRSGRAYLISGSTGALIYELTSPNEESGGRFGQAASGVPDADGDGLADLLIGAPSEDPGASPFSAGRAYLFSGSSGALLAELVSPSDESGGQFGDAVAGVPDLDGDGRGDLLVGAPYEDAGVLNSNVGRAYLFRGPAGSGTPDVDLTLEATSPTSVAPGDSVSFDYTITNTTGSPGSGVLRAEVQNATGVTIATLGVIARGEVAAGETVAGSFTQGVPEGADPGTYTLVVLAVTDSGQVRDAETVGIVVTEGERRTSQADMMWSPPALEGGLGGESAERSMAPPVIAPIAVYPNPSQARTTLRFTLDKSAPVRLTVHDALGREVAVLADGVREAGVHTVVLDGRGLPAGVYAWRLETTGHVQTGRITLLR